jgi:spore coat protein A
MRITAGGAAALALARRAYPFAQTTPLSKFIQPLPGLGPTGIPVASPSTTKYPGADYYRIVMGQYTAQLHPDLPKATTLWGYGDATNLTLQQQPNFRPLGGVIVAHRNQPVRITFENMLPSMSIIPIDPTIPGADAGAYQNRTVPHLHGGHVPWTSDGGPFAWFSSSVSASDPKTHGPDWQPGDYWYPNDQSARLMWYHDHAFGQTRTNAYANIASAYLLTDDVESGPGGLISAGILPDLAGIPLVFQDKTFVPGNIGDVDPTWAWGQPGDLWYPHVYEPNSTAAGPNATGRWDWGPYDGVPPAGGTLPLPTPASNIPEGFMDHMLVNCAVLPFVEVQRKRYRFRLVNACNARFLNLQLYHAVSKNLSKTDSGEVNLAAPGPAFVQVGTEGGFLPNPVVLNDPPVQIGFGSDGNANAYNLLMAPAERADIIIDFASCSVGDVLILWSDTPAPFPGGDVRNDYYTGNPDQTAIGGAPTTRPGKGPNTRTLLQIRVVAGGTPDPLSFAHWLPALRAALPIAYAASQPDDLAQPVPAHGHRVTRGRPGDPGLPVLGKTLNEDYDAYGRLIQRLGTTDQNGYNNQGMPTWGRDFLATPVTETASAGETQVWDIYNLTGDTHPIHFHLVNVQILLRARFHTKKPTFAPIPGTERPPDDNEMGWKETVRMNPGEVTRVIMKFDLSPVPSWMPYKKSPRTGGNEYVWHCHILEHEEHDMMRNLVVY